MKSFVAGFCTALFLMFLLGAGLRWAESQNESFSEDASASEVESSSEAEVVDAEVVEEESPFFVGETIYFDDFEITVTKAWHNNVVGNNEFIRVKAAEGAFFLVIEWSYKNVTSRPVDAFSLPKLYMEDPNGYKYAPDLDATSSLTAGDDKFNAKSLSDLNPGISVNDGEVFEISAELFDPNTWKIRVETEEYYNYFQFK